VTRAGEIWSRWIEVLAAVLFAWREAWRGRHALLVSRENDGFVVRRADGGGNPVMPEMVGADGSEGFAPGTMPATLSPGSQAPDELMRAARSGLVIHELPADEVVMRRIKIPVQAREFLPGIVRNQVERLSPWQADQAAYGFDAEVSRDDAASLDVRVLICSRSAVDSVREELEGIGLPPDRIVVRQGGGENIPAVALWSRLSDAPHEVVERRRRQVGLAIVALVLASAALSLWASFSAASIRAESEEAAARSKTLQRQLQGSRTPQALASLPPEQRAWLSKESSLSTVIVLEALSRALPDAAYLTELHIDNTKLRVIGLTSDAPSLIAPLERSGHFSDVRFFAPTTRGPDGTLFRFHIEARVVPRLEITEN
jgi:general secretion pathway protein L